MSCTRQPRNQQKEPNLSPAREQQRFEQKWLEPLPTPAEHLSRRDGSVNTVPRSSGTLASLAKQSNRLLQSVITRMDKCSTFHSSGSTSSKITTSHNMARVYSARSRASRHALASAPNVDKRVLFEASTSANSFVRHFAFSDASFAPKFTVLCRSFHSAIQTVVLKPSQAFVIRIACFMLRRSSAAVISFSGTHFAPTSVGFSVTETFGNCKAFSCTLCCNQKNLVLTSLGISWFSFKCQTDVTACIAVYGDSKINSHL